MLDLPQLGARWARSSYGRTCNWKAALPVSIMAISMVLLAQMGYLSKSESWTPISPETPRANRINASDLLTKPLATIHEQGFMPKYIHQSWMTDELPTKLSRWSETCQVQHPEWQWILWTDEDNLKMVEKYFPWFLETYKALPAEINRADAARNMYMYLFGGVYADLDTECLKPLDRLFLSHGVLTDNDSISEQTALLEYSSTVFFGRMGFDNTDVTLYHTIPNAWMASTPGIPLFLLVLEQLMAEMSRQNHGAKTTAEDLTGPVALYKVIEAYDYLQDEGISPQDFLLTNASYGLFERTSIPQRLIILPPENVYPYPWNNAGKWYRSACWSHGFWFNSKRCKKLVASEETYTITYWSHTWNEDLGKTHDEHSLGKVGGGRK